MKRIPLLLVVLVLAVGAFLFAKSIRTDTKLVEAERAQQAAERAAYPRSEVTVAFRAERIAYWCSGENGYRTADLSNGCPIAPTWIRPCRAARRGDHLPNNPKWQWPRECQIRARERLAAQE